MPRPLRPLALLAALLLCPAPGARADLPRFAATAPTTVPTTLNKPAPESVDDLRALQAQLKTVLAKVAPSVVGLRVGGGQGSGVIISEDGYVLTAGHVASAPNRDVTVVLPDGKTVKGKTLGINYPADSGLVKISDPPPAGGKWPAVPVGRSAALTRGQWCFALGHPGGFKQGRTPPLRLGKILGTRGAFVRSDCTLVGGDSGGPLFDLAGNVIAIHSRIGNSVSDNMHVPADIYGAEWEQLASAQTMGLERFGPRAGGAWIGIQVDTSAEDCRITEVFDDSPAQKAGLQVGDVVTRFDRSRIANFGELMLRLGNYKPGEEVGIEVLREDKPVRVKMTLAKRPNN